MQPLHYPLRVLQNNLGLIPKPSWVTCLVTYRCNALCKMCDSPQLGKINRVEMLPHDYHLVFKKLGSLDIVRLSGGEPFIRKDILEIAEAIRHESHPMVIHITTNGSYTERVLDFLSKFSKPSLLRFMVSFDGMPETHNKNRGEAASFAKAMQTVKSLAKLRHLGHKVSINHTVVNSQSLADHNSLSALARELDVDVQTVLAYADSAMYGKLRRNASAEDLIVPEGYPLHPALEGADCIGFVEQQIANLHHIRDPILRRGKSYYERGLLARLKREPKAQPKPKCVALRSHLRLLANGDVPVCQFNSKIIGNLLTANSLEELMRSAVATEQRAWVDSCTGCWAECEVMPNSIYSGDILKPYK